MKTNVSMPSFRSIFEKCSTFVTYFFLLLFTLFCLPVHAQVNLSANHSGQIPDTLIIKMTKIKGYGPFPLSFGMLQNMDPSNIWIRSKPEIKGIPENLRNLMSGTFEVDFLQYTYQSYYAGKISESLFASCRNSWHWEPDPAEFTKQEIKGSIAVAAGYDENNRLRIFVDKNNNYDLNDDGYFILPDIKEGQNIFSRYNDSLLIEAAYEYYDGRDVRKSKAWMYIDYGPEMLIPNLKDSSIKLLINHAEHYLGGFVLDNKNYSIALMSDGRPVAREHYNILLGEKGKGFAEGSPADERGTEKGGLIRIGDYYYKFLGASLDGSKVILARENVLDSTEGNQVGLKALKFTGQTIDGLKINLSELKGKYVLLDFWGTWCKPCREEIKSLKEIYETCKNKNFLMLGIANDDVKTLKSFVEKQDLAWPQIAQDQDKSILKLYNVLGYPTTYLIDPEGRIVAKNLRGPDLIRKLKSIFTD